VLLLSRWFVGVKDGVETRKRRVGMETEENSMMKMKKKKKKKKKPWKRVVLLHLDGLSGC